MGSGRARRRRRQRKHEKRSALPRRRRSLVPAGVKALIPRPRFRRRQPKDSPGDQLAVEMWRDDEPPGGAPVREPRRPYPPGPLAGAAALELPPEDDDLDAVAEQRL